MAYSSKKKAAWISQIINGMTITEAAQESGISRAQLSEWMKGARESVNAPIVGKSETRENRYIFALEKFVCTALGMVTAQAELYSDKDYLRSQQSSDVIAQSEFVFRQLKQLLEFEQRRALPAGGNALPAETIVAEVVDE